MNEIIKVLNQASYKHSILNVFHDFTALMALEMSARTECLIKDVSKRIEKIKLIQQKYNEEELICFRRFKEIIIHEITENRFQDFFGELFHKLELHNKYKGQFFTPYCLSYTAAKISIDINTIKEIEKKDISYIGEPACGSGGMCIAVCQLLEAYNINYASKIIIEANDIDINCVYMSYIQLSLIGAAARINHKNTLSEEHFDDFITLAALANRSFKRLALQNKEEAKDKKQEQYVFDF